MYIDIIIFLVFLLVNLFIGINSMCRTTTLQQYAVGTKGFNTAEIVSAILSLSYGAVMFYTPFSDYLLLFCIGRALSSFIIANLLASRLQFFLKHYSVAEFMGKHYGAAMRKIIAIAGLYHSVLITSLQIKAFALSISWLFCIQESYGLCIATFLIIFSIGWCGIKSLSLVNIVRCAVFGILLPTIAWILWKQLLQQCHADQLRLASSIRESWASFIDPSTSAFQYIALLIAFSIPSLHPAQFQRVLIVENAVQMKRSFNCAGFFSLGINLLLFWIALLLNKNFGSLAIADMPLEIFNSYYGLKGLFVAAVAVLTMSVAGASLHTATVLIVNDIQNNYKEGEKMSAMNFSFYTIILCLLAACLALGMQWVQSEGLYVYMLFIWKPVLAIPVLLTVMGMRLHIYSIFAGMLMGLISLSMGSYIIPNASFYKLLFSMMMNLCSIIVVNFFLKKTQTQSRFYNVSAAVSQEIMHRCISLSRICYMHISRTIMQFNVWDFIQTRLPKDNLSYVLFSFYITVTGYCTFYTFSSNAIWSTQLEAMILFPSLFVTTFFLAYSSLTPTINLRKIVSIVWILSKFYFLFLVGSAMLILSKFSDLQIVILLLNIYLSILISPLIDVLLQSIFTAITIWIVLPYLDSSINLIDVFLRFNMSVLYMILIIFILLSGIFYHKKRLSKLYIMINELKSVQETQNARQFFSKQQVEALAYESTYVISQLHHQLLQAMHSLGYNISSAIEDQSNRLIKYFKCIFMHLKQNLYLVTNWISTEQLLEECFDTIKINNIYHLPYVMIYTDYLYIQCDIERIKNLLINSLYSCKLHKSVANSAKRDIYIYINDTKLGYRLTLLQGRIQKVNAISFTITTIPQQPTLLPVYKVVEMADVRILDKEQKTNNLYAENQNIINAHYGYCEITHRGSEITHLYIIPVNIQEITKAFAALSPVVYTQSVELDPNSIEQERVFCKKLKEHQIVDQQSIMDVLKLIKTYYATQRRKTGELFYLHPMAVASILLDFTTDENIIIGGLVHDVVQNTPLTEAGLSTLLGEGITQMILAIEQLERKLQLHENDYSAYIEWIINNQHYSTILIKLADTLHNAITIHGHDIEKQMRKAILIQKFYVPLANKIGLRRMADQLSLYAAKVLHMALL